MSDMKDILRRKRERDLNAYQLGFENGLTSGAMAVALILLFVVFVVIPLKG